MWIQDQTAFRSSLILIYTVCQRGFKNISAANESRRLVAIVVLKVNKCEFNVLTFTIFVKYARDHLLTLIHKT